MTASQPRLVGVAGWPTEFAERYRAAGYWAGETIGERVDAWAKAYADRIAVSDERERLTYRDLAARSQRLAGHLKAMGIHRDDRVVIQLGNTVAFCELTLALLRIGALPIMALPSHREREIGHLVEHAQAVALAAPAPTTKFDHLAMALALREEQPTLKHLLIDGDIGDCQSAVDLQSLVMSEEASADLAERPSSEDVALFLLSGGTTGLPKLIPRTHDDYLYNARASAALCDFDGDTVYLASLPASHNFPLACPGLLGTWEVGGRAVLTNDPAPEAALALIERERVTVTALVPALAIRWMESPVRDQFDLSSLELIQVGGARLAAEAARRLEPALHAHVQQVFGMAEGLLNFTRLDDSLELRAETQGRPMSPGDEIRIVDAFGNDKPPGEAGELLTRGPYTLRGYYRAEAHNARAFTPDGYYRTGDIVSQHESGNLVVEGRAKDLINRGGEKISAEDIENLILAHPSVFNVAAVAMPDPEMGERTCVYVVLRDERSLTLAELCAFLTTEQRIAKYKLPERLEIISDLPVTKVGKIDKKVLREDIRAKLEGVTEGLVWAS